MMAVALAACCSRISLLVWIALPRLWLLLSSTVSNGSVCLLGQLILNCFQHYPRQLCPTRGHPPHPPLASCTRPGGVNVIADHYSVLTQIHLSAHLEHR